ncbi:cation:proton antiporter [Cellvibrio japonicus]|uniref:Putative pH regulated Na(+)/H(+) antiporter n=1 Tax=Cellvibrio japonicus (strain Ueda107) TaxID=498211 RepID=B3PCK2_CELJU|nr:sodium:proton antiporter [Cellvibrio japonicus]ACE84737.1 putative pH regulated Na(+)/H(+) antiporter [Cellvibrio japonicus Ueda107]QEI13232.1 sodium:proton antiporter [Cellvibrio japonicus]QEI16806.1 sodium:proton antiporter [Cellvibrio japonicus]QEI20384.1 sodium:proton antiporter [Cellvibrio japonicus]
MSSLEVAKHDLLYVGVIIFAGLLGGVLARRIKVPDIVLFLVIGIALGPTIGGLLHVPADSVMNQMILTVGACYLLFEGGATLRFVVLREVWITLLLISTLGVLITGAITAAVGVWFGLPLAIALVLGALTASTDPATLIPIFKQVPIKDRVSQTVMSESALNDAMGAIATFAVVGYVMGTGGGFSLTGSLQTLAWEVGMGLLLGGLVGYAAAFLMAHNSFGIFRDVTPFVIILAVITVYLLADAVHASGFMAVFTCGVIIGNKEAFGLPLDHHEHEYLEDYMGNTALLMRMFIFILLGSQVDFHLLKEYLGIGLALLAVFIVIARPLTVFLCAAPDRRAKWSLKELLFMSWTRETGVIPAALVGILAGMKVPGMDVVGAITFIFILGTILIQATTTSLLAGKLGLLKSQQP